VYHGLDKKALGLIVHISPAGGVKGHFPFHITFAGSEKIELLCGCMTKCLKYTCLWWRRVSNNFLRDISEKGTATCLTGSKSCWQQLHLFHVFMQNFLEVGLIIYFYYFMLLITILNKYTLA